MNNYIWTNNVCARNNISIPLYLDKNYLKIKQIYLDSIYDLSHQKIGNKTIIEHLKINDNFSLWWMSLIAEKSLYKSPYIKDVLKLLAFEDLLIKDKFNEFIFQGNVNQKTYSSILKLSKIYNKKLIFKGSILKKENTSSKERLYFSLPYFLQGLTWLIRYILKNRKLNTNCVKNNNNNNDIFFMSYFIHLNENYVDKNEFFSSQWSYLPNLIKEIGSSIYFLHHFVPSNYIPNTENAIRLATSFNNNIDNMENHDFISSSINSKIIFQSFLKWIKFKFKFNKLKLFSFKFVPKGYKLNYWVFFKDDFYSSVIGKVGIENLLYYELFKQKLNKQNKFQLGFLLYEGQGWEQAFLYFWRKYEHGKIFGLAHATIRHWDLRYFHSKKLLKELKRNFYYYPNKILVNGPYAWDELLKMDIPSNLISKVEAIRYNDYNLSYKYDKRPPNLDTSIKILILGDFLKEENNFVINYLEQLPMMLESKIKLSFKPHPGNPIYPLSSKYNINTTTKPLIKILNDYDIIYSTNPSSAALDAYLLNKYLIVQVSYDGLNFSPLKGVNNVKFIKNIEDLENSIVCKKTKKNVHKQNYFWFSKNDIKFKGFLKNQFNNIR